MASEIDTDVGHPIYMVVNRIIAFSILLAGFLGGFFLGRVSQPSRERTVIPGESVSSRAAVAMAQSEGNPSSTLATKSANLNSKLPIHPPNNNVAVENSALPDPVLDRVFGNTPFDLLLPNNKLSDELCDVVAITDDEREQLNNDIQQTLTSLKTEQRKNTTIVESDADTTQVLIQKFSSEGGKQQQQLMDTISRRLGEERGAVFRRLTLKAIRAACLGFGQEDVSITVKGLSKGPFCEVFIKSGAVTRIFEAPGMPDVLKGVIDVE